MGNCVKAPLSEVAVISGPTGTNMYSGRSAWRWWFIQRLDRLSLELLTLQVRSCEAETVRGVRVTVHSVCQVKVDAWLPEEGGPRSMNKAAVTLACQHFLGNATSHVEGAILKTLEGHQRQILGTLTVEELYKDRSAFAERIREHVYDDLLAMGYTLVSYTVTGIDDAGGYMAALGVTQTELVKREAAEGSSKNRSEATKATSMYEAEAQKIEAINQANARVAELREKEKEAQAARDLDMTKAAFVAEVNTAQAVAEAALGIERAKQEQKILTHQLPHRQVEKAKVLLDYQDAEVLRQQKELEGASKAELLQATNQAKAKLVSAEAEAERVRLVGEAEARVIVAKGEAEAQVRQKHADAYAAYGQAAMLQLVVEKLPEVASALATPLGQIDKINFVSSDGNTFSKLTGDVSTMLGQLGPAVANITGFDINQGLAALSGQGQGQGQDAPADAPVAPPSSNLRQFG
ncbi:unnamed protein product [Chrysoparadoxa australica]